MWQTKQSSSRGLKFIIKIQRCTAKELLNKLPPLRGIQDSRLSSNFTTPKPSGCRNELMCLTKVEGKWVAGGYTRQF